MTVLNIKREKSTWLPFIATVLLSGLFAFANLSEFVAVGMLNKTSGYPFGGEGPTPWFYKSAQLYATVNLIFGILFLVSFSMATWAFVRVQRKALVISFALSILFVVLQLLTGQPD
jgi:glycopeptide antibiotics resistance protein